MTKRSYAATWRRLVCVGLLAALCLPGTARAEGLTDGHPHAGAVLGAGLVHPAAGAGHPAQPGRVDVRAIVREAALWHGVRPEFLQCLAHRESSHRPWVTSAWGEAGLFQFKARTWKWMSRAAGWPAGTSPYSAVAAADVTAWAIAHGLRGHWPPSRFCGRAW